MEKEVAYKRSEIGAMEARLRAAEERYMGSLAPGAELSKGTEKLRVHQIYY